MTRLERFRYWLIRRFLTEHIENQIVDDARRCEGCDNFCYKLTCPQRTRAPIIVQLVDSHDDVVFLRYVIEQKDLPKFKQVIATIERTEPATEEDFNTLLAATGIMFTKLATEDISI